MGRIQGFIFSRSLTAIEVFILAVLLLFGYTKDIASVEFHPDEIFWIASSERLDRFLAGDFNSPFWTEDPIIIFEVRPIPSYFAGIGQRLAGISPGSLPPVYWDWNLSETENIALGAMPSNETIWWSRLPMAVLSALSMLITCIFLANLHSRLAAYIFLAVGFNGYFLLHLRRAMSEASILFFTALVLATAHKLLQAAKQGDMKTSIQWSVIIGIFSGLAGESKLTGLACAGIAILGAALVLIPKPAQWLTILKQRLLLITIFVVLVATLSTFIASYPLFYTDTVDGIWETFYAREQILDFQVQTYTDELIRPKDRAAILFQRVFDYPLHAGAGGTPGILAHWFNLLITCLGIAFVFKQAWKNSPGDEPYAILLISALLIAVPMLFAPLDWERYYIFPIFFSCIFFTIGISEQTIKLSRRKLYEQ